MAATRSPASSTSSCARNFRAPRPTLSTRRPSIPAVMQSTSPSAAGYGDLASQGFNAYAMVDYQKFGGIEARDRPFAARNYIPEEGVDRTSINSFPANVDTPAGVRNPTGDPARGYAIPSCAPPLSFPTAGSAEPVPVPLERRRLASDLQSERAARTSPARSPGRSIQTTSCFSPVPTSATSPSFAIWPTQVSNQTTFQQRRSFLLPATSPFYPHDFARAFGIDGTPLNVYWSAIELGPRTIAPITEQWNVVAGMRGVVMGWTYDGAFNYSRSDVDQRATDGYVRESALLPILNSGVVNPFGPNTPAIVDLMSTAKFDGTLRTGNVEHDFARLHRVHRGLRAPVGSAVAGHRRSAPAARNSTQTSDPGARVRRRAESRRHAVVVGRAQRLGAVRRGEHSSRQRRSRPMSPSGTIITAISGARPIRRCRCAGNRPRHCCCARRPAPDSSRPA